MFSIARYIIHKLIHVTSCFFKLSAFKNYMKSLEINFKPFSAAVIVISELFTWNFRQDMKAINVIYCSLRVFDNVKRFVYSIMFSVHYIEKQ